MRAHIESAEASADIWAMRGLSGHNKRNTNPGEQVSRLKAKPAAITKDFIENKRTQFLYPRYHGNIEGKLAKSIKSTNTSSDIWSRKWRIYGRTRTWLSEQLHTVETAEFQDIRQHMHWGQTGLSQLWRHGAQINRRGRKRKKRSDSKRKARANLAEEGTRTTNRQS